MPATFVLNKSTFQPKAIIEDYQQINWTRNMWEAGKFEMTININQFSATQITKGDLIGISLNVDSPSFDQVYLVEQIEYQAGPTILNEIINVSGRDVSAYLEDRIILPDAGQRYSTITGATTESAMKFYVTKNVASGALPARQVPNLFVKLDLGRGFIHDYNGRFQKVSDYLEEIGRSDDMGWHIFFEDSTNTFQFDVIVGNNRTINASFPVIWDFEFDNAKTMKLLKSDFGRKTLGIVAGQGEGAARSVIQTWIPSSAAEPAGFDRRELFIDARDLDNNVALALRGTAKLKETNIDDSFELEINQTSPQQYRVDWDLGDLVTARNRKWNFQKDMRIIEIKNSITPEVATPQTSISLDKIMPRLQSRIKRGLSQFEVGRRF